MIYIKNIFKCCFVILGTVIGAGFASGKEIYSFFCIYGISGLQGIIISSAIIGLIIYLTFKIIFNNNIDSYSNFTNYLIGSRKNMSYTINNLMNIFLFISFVVMVTGFGSFFKQEFNVSNIVGSLLICVLSFVAFFKSINGIIKINSFLIPVLIILIILLGFKNNIFFFNISILPISYGFNWLMKSFLYASYNSITLIPIIINLKPLVENEKQIRYISFLSFFLMIIMSLIIYIVLSINILEIKHLDIPLVYIASKFGIFYKYLYSFTILIAIFTTAISAGFSFLNNISKNKKQYFFFSILMCTIAILCSNVGFSSLLSILYPFLGFLGFFEIILIIHRALQK